LKTRVRDGELKQNLLFSNSLLTLKLDMSRNKLLTINTFIALGAMTFGIGSFIGALFGKGGREE